MAPRTPWRRAPPERDPSDAAPVDNLPAHTEAAHIALLGRAVGKLQLSSGLTTGSSVDDLSPGAIEMSLAILTSPEAVETAIAEFESIGRDHFLEMSLGNLALVVPVDEHASGSLDRPFTLGHPIGDRKRM